MDSELVVNLNGIPNGWFLYSLANLHTPIIRVGDLHTHRSWMCQLQHINGGKLTEFIGGETPQHAVNECIKYVKLRNNLT